MAGQVQLVLKGLEDTYLTGTPQISYFRSVFNSFDQFEIKYQENQFYATTVSYGKPQLCIIKKYGDLVRSNFLKVELESLFTTNSPSYVWCYPYKTASQIRPNIYLFDENFNEIDVLTTKDTCVYYNTSQSTWLPPGVSIDLSANKFNFNLECSYIGFDSKDEALFWGFKNYDSFKSYTIFKNQRYIFQNRKTSEITLKSSGWVNQFIKYLREYKPNVGSILIDKIELYIGSQLIETIPGKYLSVYKDIRIPEQLQNSLNYLEGSDPQPSTSQVVYYVYLPLSLKNMPICALSRQEIEILISFNDFTTLVDTQYLNIPSQFEQIGTLNSPVYSTVYDGNVAYFINQTGVVNKNFNFGENVVPKSAIRANQDIYIASQGSNLIQYSTQNNVSNSFNYMSAYTIKSPIGLVYTTTLLNFTKNGLVQNLGTDINEFLIDTTGVKRLYYFNTYILLVCSNTISVYMSDLTFDKTYTIYDDLTIFTKSSSTLYMLSNSNVYTYTASGLSSPAKLPELNPTAATYNNGLYVYYTSKNVYFEGSLINTLIDDSNIVSGVSISQVSTQQKKVYTIGNFNGYRYKTLGTSDRYTQYDTDRPFLKIIPVDERNCLFLSNNSIFYTTQTGTSNISLGTTLSNNVYTTYDELNKFYILDDNLNFVIYDTLNNTVTPKTYQPLSPIYPQTLSYDGQYIYMFPSNGQTKLVKYDTNKPLNSTESYSFTNIIDSTTTTPKPMYILTTSFDGVNIYALPSSLDGNIITYNTFNSSYNFIDFIKNGRDYTPQTITDSIIIDTDLFMLSQNGFYRYDTSFSGTSLTSSPISFSNAFLTVYDSINSNVYIFSNNFSDGFMYIKTNSRDPTPTVVKPYTYQNTFTSYVNYGSLYYMVPSNSNTGLIITQSSPATPTEFSWNYPPNASNTSVLVGTKLYMFPGPSSQNTIVYDITTKTSNVITTPKRNYKTATFYGNYIYLTDDSNIIRFNTTLDTFSDYSGYSVLSANTHIKSTDYIATNLSNVYFVGSNIIRYDISSNTYTTFNGNLPGTTLGVSASNLYILKDTGNLHVSNISYTNIASKDDTPLDVTGNAQYIFTLFKNRLGRIDLANGGDLHGTGYYTYNSVTNPALGNVTATVELNGNIYSVFDSNTVTRYNGLVYSSNANIASVNTFTKAYTWYSNVIFLGNSFVMYDTNNTLTTSNLVITRFGNSLSSFANTDSHFYFTNKTSNIIVQYDYVAKSNIVYTPNVIGGFSEAYNYNSNIFFFPYQSNILVSYSSQTQNFRNFSDIINRIQWNGSNIVSSNDNYILTDNGRVFKLTDKNTRGDFIGYTTELINKSSLGYRVFFNSGVNQIINGTTYPLDGIDKIITDVYFYSAGTWYTSKQNVPITVPAPGLVRNIQLFGGEIIRDTKTTFFIPGSSISDALPKITTKNYIVASDGTGMYNLDTQTYYGKNQTTTQYYPLFGNVTIGYDNTQTSVLDVKYQTVEQMVRDFSHRVQTSFGNVFVTAQKVDAQTVNVITTQDASFNSNVTIGTITRQNPTYIQYAFRPNSPLVNNFTFTNVYSSQRFTYIFNNGKSDMIVYANDTLYSSPLRSFPVPGNVNTMIHQGVGNTTVVYMITDNYSNVYRFNEESDSSSYTNLNITKTSQGAFSNASMFSLTDGIGIASESNIYGFGIQNKFTNVYTSSITNPVTYNSNVYFFTTAGDKYVYAPLNKISDIQTAKYTEVSIPNPGAFKYAFADSKFLYIVKTGNVIYNTGNVQISWDTKAYGKISNSISYVISSNTSDLVLSYTNTDRETYKFYQYNLPSILSNTVQVYGNTAYMLPTTTGNIVSFNMDTLKFGTVSVQDSSVLYFSPNVYVTPTRVNGVTYTASNINSVSDDGRYVSISTPSNVIQFDYVANIFLPNKSINSNVTIRYGSNIFFFNKTQVSSYSFNPRSYISVPIESNSNGVQFYNGNVYFSSTTNVYRASSNLQNISVVTRSLGTPGKSLLYNSNIAFSYDTKILAFDTMTSANSYITLPKFNRFTVDPSNVFYTTLGMSISRDTVVNSNLVFSPTFTNLGPIFYYGSNVYALADNNTFVVYNSNSLPFSANALFYSQNVSTVFTKDNFAYYPPGLDGNILQVFDMTKPFFSFDAYTNSIKVSNNNYKSFVTLSDSTYFVPTNSANLIRFSDGSEIKGYNVPQGTLTSGYDGKSIYLSNSTSINKFYFTPLVTSNAFSNAIYFTQQSNINNIIFDGSSIYALCDVVYNINTSTIAESDATGIFQDTSKNILDRNLYNTGYFDGRFLNLVTDTIKIYDVNPIVYPRFFSPSIITEYVYLSERDRISMQTKELKYMVKQLQTVDLPTNSYNRINFWNPLSEIIIDGDVSKFEMYLNGHEKIHCDGNLMSTIQLLKHQRRPTRSDVHVYSFASNPDDEFPDTHVNMSRIIDKVLRVDSTQPYVKLYGITHNIVKFRDGLGGLVFNNSSQ